MSAYNSLNSGVKDKFFTSFWSTDKSYREAVDLLLRDKLMGNLKRYVKDMRPIFSNFMVKRPGSNGECLPHQDWNYVNEKEHCSMTVWCALHDMNDNEGCLRVFPGSHLINCPVRGRDVQNYLVNVQPFIRNHLMQKTSLKKGQAIIMNSRAVHGSESNHSDNDRIAVALMAVPVESQCIHYAANPAQPHEINVMCGEGGLFVNHNCFESLDLTASLDQFNIEERYMRFWDLLRLSPFLLRARCRA